jgi:hypothetical protein
LHIYQLKNSCIIFNIKLSKVKRKFLKIIKSFNHVKICNIAYRKEPHGSLTEALLFQGQQCNSMGAVKLTAVRFFLIGYGIHAKNKKVLTLFKS